MILIEFRLKVPVKISSVMLMERKDEWDRLKGPDPSYFVTCVLSIYLFIRHTPSYEYYVPGSPQHAIKVRVKNKADRENRIKVHSVSVLNSRYKEKVRIKTVVYTFMV